MKLLNRKSEWFIFAGFAMIIVAAISESFLPKLASGVNTLSEWRKYVDLRQSWQNVVVGQLDWVGKVILASSLVIIGFRMLRIKLQRFKATLFIVAGLGICAFTLITSYFAMTFDYSIPKPDPELLKRNIETHNYDSKLKSKLSRMYAGDKYKYEEKTVEYFGETGEKLQYQPTKDDLKFREQDVLVKEIWSATQRLARRNFYIWCGITTVSLLLGFFTPVRKEHPIG